jgi:hypothetical protein
MSASAMAKHEKHCTANPDRVCRICDSAIKIKPLIEKFKNSYTVEIRKDAYDNDYTPNIHFFSERIINWKEKEITIEDIKKEVDNCPNCTLAIVRQAFPDSIIYYEDYKKDLADALRNINEENLY